LNLLYGFIKLFILYIQVGIMNLGDPGVFAFLVLLGCVSGFISGLLVD
jgi:hypothetical protein